MPGSGDASLIVGLRRARVQGLTNHGSAVTRSSQAPDLGAEQGRARRVEGTKQVAATGPALTGVVSKLLRLFRLQ